MGITKKNRGKNEQISCDLGVQLIIEYTDEVIYKQWVIIDR